MKTILGLDLGTSSIGWALINTENEKSVPDKVSLSSTDTKKKEQVVRYLSVCYPLSSIKINSLYGYRKDPFTGKRKFHNGIDLHARSDKVFAMMQGRVLKVGQDKVSGKYVTLQHGSFTVNYCHLSQISVSQGRLFCRVMLLELRVIRGAAQVSILLFVKRENMSIPGFSLTISTL